MALLGLVELLRLPFKRGSAEIQLLSQFEPINFWDSREICTTTLHLGFQHFLNKTFICQRGFNFKST